MRTFRTSVALLCGFLFLACPLFGQINRGTITGLVLDQQGLSVADAKVTAVNAATGLKTETTTGSTGTFTFPGLPVGRYQVSCEMAGFKKFVQEHVVVEVGQTISVNLQLQLGAVTEQVTVTARPSALDTTTSDVGTTVPREQIMALPSPMTSDSRNPLNFVIMTPGVYGSIPGATPDLRLHVSGAPSGSMAVYIDGIPIADTDLTGEVGSNHPSIEAIGEFKITNNNESAQYGLGSSSASFTFRSGTNQWHGSGYEFLQNDHLNALDFVTAGKGGKKAPLKQNEFGFTLGGPITIPKIYSGRNRSFFFVSFTDFLYRPSANTSTLTTFPNQFRTGDFSQLLGAQLTSGGYPVYDPAGRPVYTGAIYDPTTSHSVVGPNGTTYLIRDPLPGNQISMSSPKISAVAKALLPYFPQATNNAIYSNLTRLTGSKVDETRFVAKIDHNFRGNQFLSGSFFRGTYVSSNNGALALSTATQANYPSLQVRLSHTYTGGGKLINSFNFGFLRDYQVTGPVEPGPLMSSLGLKGISLPAGAPLPSIQIRNQGAIGSETNAGVVQNRFILNDSITWLRGAHTLKFGGEVRRLQRNEIPANSGRYVFEPMQTALNGVGFIYKSGLDGPATAVSMPAGTGVGAASFLFGGPDFTYFTLGYTANGYRWRTYGTYFQDDWKITRSLTLNLGLRYDVQIPREEVWGRVATLDRTLPNYAVGNRLGAFTFYGQGTGRNGRPRIGVTEWRAFQPRVGFAFSPEGGEGILGRVLGSSRTVLRGGFAINRPTGNDTLNNGLGGSLYAPGWNGIATVNRPGDYVGSPAFIWDNPFPNFTPPPFIDPSLMIGNVNPPMVVPSAGIPPTQINWTFGLERALPGNMVVKATYVGSHAYHIGMWLKPNEVDPAVAQRYASAAAAAGIPLNQFLALSVTDSRAVAAGITPPFSNFVSLFGSGATVGQALRPFPQYGNIDNIMNPVGSSSYNGLQTSLQKRFSQGLTFLVSYTWSKTMGTADAFAGAFAGAENAIYGASFMQDFYNMNSERSVTSSDIPHVLAISYVYELPVGPGKKFLNHRGVLGKLVGGWQASGIAMYQTGRPLHIEYDVWGADNPLKANDGYTFRPNIVPGVPIVNPDYRRECAGPLPSTKGRVPCQFYINPAAFSAPPNGGFGNAARFYPGLRTPYYLNEDLSVTKRIVITEKLNLQFQANFFNVFNRVVLGGIANITNVAPKDLTTANLVSSNTPFGIFTSQANGPRRIQFALKLEF
jgi:hypothetical protein